MGAATATPRVNAELVKTGNKTPADTRFVPVTIQQGAVQAYIKADKFSLRTHIAHKTREIIRC